MTNRERFDNSIYSLPKLILELRVSRSLFVSILDGTRQCDMKSEATSKCRRVIARLKELDIWKD